MAETDLAALTIQVAKEVMGCRVKKCRDGTYSLVVPGSFDRISFVEPEGAWAACPKYPIDWSAAGEVLEKMTGELADEFAAALMKELDILMPRFTSPQEVVSGLMGLLTPLAICLAALAAVRGTKSEQST